MCLFALHCCSCLPTPFFLWEVVQRRASRQNFVRQGDSHLLFTLIIFISKSPACFLLPVFISFDLAWQTQGSLLYGRHFSQSTHLLPPWYGRWPLPPHGLFCCPSPQFSPPAWMVALREARVVRPGTRLPRRPGSGGPGRNAGHHQVPPRSQGHTRADEYLHLHSEWEH